MSLDLRSSTTMVDRNLVDKILEQGQRLRNSMVQSILNNDPFNTDIIYDKHYNTPQSSSVDVNLASKIDNLHKLDDNKIEAFLKGDYMAKEDEILALETLRSMSASDLCKTTERTYCSYQTKCNCSTCRDYYTRDLTCDIKRNAEKPQYKTISNDQHDITKKIQDQYKNDNYRYLKCVDSLRICVHSLVLNEAGNKKVSNTESDKVKVPPTQTYFLEYEVPDILTNSSTRSKSKVDSGLENNSIVRLCSRRHYSEAISFKQISVHDISNVKNIDLHRAEIKFRISSRNSKQKHANLLGYAKFNFSSFEVSKNLTCNRGIVITLNENAPIVLGTLKVSLQLGCGKLYFGKEFIEAINSNTRNSVALASDDSAVHLYEPSPRESITLIDEGHDDKRQLDFKHSNVPKEPSKLVKSHSISRKTCETQTDKCKSPTKNSVRSFDSDNFRKVDKRKYDMKENKVDTFTIPQIKEAEKQILFGFLYISEAKYLTPALNSYITCRPFCEDDTSNSRLIWDSSNPLFNFCQTIPLVYEDDLLSRLRENFMLVEFWQKTETKDVVFGLTKVPLHQFYIAYRNPVILKYLVKNKLPIIGTDWWEPIQSVVNQDVLGQVQVLIALGTEEQIRNLELERGFKNHLVKAKFSPRNSVENPKKPFQNIINKTSFGEPKQPLIRDFLKSDLSKNVTFKDMLKGDNKKAKQIQKADVATQSDSIKMDSKEECQKKSPTQEMLGSFLNELMAQRQKNICVENSTNTELSSEVPTQSISRTDNENNLKKIAQDSTNTEMKKTSELLESLQKALSMDGKTMQSLASVESTTFRAQVIIHSALHLPSRKKCKSKKSKNRAGKSEDSILPSTYVTFETTQGVDFKVTHIVSKSTCPKWDYHCDVNLPMEMLTNNQKRLIFKVWRKSTNTVMQPNTQTDIVLGFAAVDLSVLLAGLPNVQGWFNIIDFSGKCNGQINIHVNPLENILRFQSQKDVHDCDNLQENTIEHDVMNALDEPSELLSRTLKRKFTELDEITQRLRLRLSKVTNEDSDCSNDEVADEFEKDINTLCIEEDFDLIDFEEEARKLNQNYNKEGNIFVEIPTQKEERTTGLNLLHLANEKLKKLSETNTLMTADNEPSTTSMNSGGATSSSNVQSMEVSECKKSDSNVETDDSEISVPFSSDSNKKSVNSDNSSSSSNVTTLDKNVLEGKQRIDTLLEKLSLMTAESTSAFSNRYVSGCSVNNDDEGDIDTEAILKELDHSSRPNIHCSSNFDPIMFQQLYGGSQFPLSNSCSITQTPRTTNSDTSVVSSFSDCRLGPEGQQGSTTDDKNVESN